MISCPQCGDPAPEGTKFCERCGQGLASAAPAPAPLSPLSPGTRLKGGYEIVELLNQTSQENRYRALIRRDDAVEFFQLRERIGPTAEAGLGEPATVEAEKTAETAPEDANGPRAKTAELRLRARSADADPGTAPAEAASEPPACAQPTPEAAGEDASRAAAGEPADQTGQAQAEPSAEPIELAAESIVPPNGAAAPPASELPAPQAAAQIPADDLGEVFGRVMSLSLTLNHPAFQRAIEGFAQDGRVYLVYRDEKLTPLSRRPEKMHEAEAINVAIQVCQAVSFVNRRGLRLNDICPDSVAFNESGRIKVTGLECVSNDLEMQSEPIFNDGYTAPEIYRGKGVDKRADVFSIGCLLYTCLTGERIACESWREEAGPVRFYPPHVISPELEQAVRRAIAFRPAERWAGVDALKAELLKLGAGFTVRSGGLTDVGMVRELNEDSVMIADYVCDSQVAPAESHLYVVSDGMGGAEAGETASAIAVGTIREYVEKELASAAGRNPSLLLQAALEEANLKVLEYQAAHPESRGMGATAVAALIIPPEAAVAWVGDSRAYLYGEGKLRQLTKDHSLVQRLVEIGQITPQEARHHEHKNVITRSLGARQSGRAGAETLALKLRRGERLMLCSDGLTTHVEDSQISEILGRHTDPYEAARELVVAANADGGTDNISVIAVFAD